MQSATPLSCTVGIAGINAWCLPDDTANPAPYPRRSTVFMSRSHAALRKNP